MDELVDDIGREPHRAQAARERAIAGRGERGECLG
jgi:hypothetical protein